MVLGSIEYQLGGEPQEPVKVHRGPLGWLRSGTDGIVLLTRDQFEQRSLLQGIEHITSEDRQHTAELNRIMGNDQRRQTIIDAESEAAKVVPLQAVRPAKMVRMR